jgi:cation diffusion facilitator family transporter
MSPWRANLVHTTSKHLEAPPRLIMSLSLGVAVLMLGGKMTAYLITGSAAILSDALESVVHLFATGFAAFSLWYASRPADDSHPYGHGKIAYFSSGFEGGMILLAAVTIIYTAVVDLIKGPELEQLGLGFLITAGLALINLALGIALIRIGRSHHSIVVESNGQHVLTDMWTSLGVLVGIGLVQLTGWVWLDPVTAILLGLNIMWTAGTLIRRSVSGLMEEAVPADQLALSNTLQRAVEKGNIVGWHELRHRRVYAQIWVEYHLLFPDEISVTEAHDRAHVLDDAIRALFPHQEVVVTAHFEPATRHDAAHPFGHEAPV